MILDILSGSSSMTISNNKKNIGAIVHDYLITTEIKHVAIYWLK